MPTGTELGEGSDCCGPHKRLHFPGEASGLVGPGQQWDSERGLPPRAAMSTLLWWEGGLTGLRSEPLP